MHAVVVVAQIMKTWCLAMVCELWSVLTSLCAGFPLLADLQATIGNSRPMSALSQPSQIVIANDDHTFHLDEKQLQEILLSEEVCNKKVVVLSVAGALRKGKSFLLDYFLRFLMNGVSVNHTCGTKL